MHYVYEQAIVFKAADFPGLNVPLPAIVQVSHLIYWLIGVNLVLSFFRVPFGALYYFHYVCLLCELKLQEYVDHSSTLFKFYVLGEKVFYAVKNSTPNAKILKNLSESNQFKPLLFDRYYMIYCCFQNPNWFKNLI